MNDAAFISLMAFASLGIPLLLATAVRWAVHTTSSKCTREFDETFLALITKLGVSDKRATENLHRIIKPWGWSQEVYRDELTRVVRIHVEPGGFCSWHMHERQVNSFVLLSGELTLEGRPRGFESILAFEFHPLTKGSLLQGVKPGLCHRFSSELGCEALEIYTSIDGTPPDENDIVRFSEGGIERP